MHSTLFFCLLFLSSFPLPSPSSLHSQPPHFCFLILLPPFNPLHLPRSAYFFTGELSRLYTFPYRCSEATTSTMTSPSTSFQQFSIKLLSLNIRSLNIPENKSQLFLRKHKADIVFLQETNFHTGSIPKLINKTCAIVCHTTNKLAQSKGVVIQISRHLPLQISDSLANKHVRYLFFIGTSLWTTPIHLRTFTSPTPNR